VNAPSQSLAYVKAKRSRRTEVRLVYLNFGFGFFVAVVIRRDAAAITGLVAASLPEIHAVGHAISESSNP
jgi:hypothetical protein